MALTLPFLMMKHLDLWGTNNTAELKTSIFNNQFANITLLSFDYFFREVPITLDSFNVQVYNGASWITVFSKSTNACPFYRGGLRCPYRAYPKEIIDITAHKNSNCQVRFVYHDGNVKAYYISIDNVRIYEPISTSIDNFVV
jgi:hypothetical protein